MGVKPRLDPEIQTQTSERFLKQVGRVYMLWLFGIVVGAVRLRPENFQFGGVAYVIENPDVLQGLIFVGCIVYYVGILATGYVAYFQFTTTNRATVRRMLYAIIRKKPTLVGRRYFDLLQIKIKAKIFISFYNVYLLIYLFLPLLQILFFQQVQFLKGVDAIFHTTSVQDGKVLLFSPAAIIGAFLAFTALSSLVGTQVIKTGRNILKQLVVSLLVLVLFAIADHYIRGQETWVQSSSRFGLVWAAYLSMIFALWLLERGIRLFYKIRHLILARRIKASLQGSERR
jgi:hypothetical protein